MADVACISGVKEVASLSNGLAFVGNITTNSGGAGTVAHGMTNLDGSKKTPLLAFCIPMSGAATTATLTATDTNIVMASGGDTLTYAVFAIA